MDTEAPHPKWKAYRNGVTSNGSTYAFTYDLKSRLLSSSRYVGDSNTATNPYTEKNITYFADSRIKTIRRYGASESSSQNLSFETDNNTYDAYGNVTMDIRTGTVINWNILNLPRKIITAGIVSEYSYLADGTKVSMKAGTTTLHYLGSMVFNQDGSTAPAFESMTFAEGRIVADSSGSKEAHYHITDHLGSVRSVVKADGTVIAENDYYPYGKRINTASATTPTQKDRHTFSGKEDQALTPGGAPYLDFGARLFSPYTARWLSVDPMAEKYYAIGTHVYCAGNPINRIDAMGMAWFYSEEDGHFINKTNTDDDTIYMLSSKQEAKVVKNEKNYNRYQKDSNSFSQKFKDVSNETIKAVLTDLYSRANKTSEGGSEEYVEQVDLLTNNLTNIGASAETKVLTTKYSNGARKSRAESMVVDPAKISTGYGAILTIAHEIGHQLHVAEGGYTFSSLNQKERYADEFAMKHWSYKLASEEERKALISHYITYQ